MDLAADAADAVQELYLANAGPALIANAAGDSLVGVPITLLVQLLPAGLAWAATRALFRVRAMA